jgi:hypothetical protein
MFLFLVLALKDKTYQDVLRKFESAVVKGAQLGDMNDKEVVAQFEEGKNIFQYIYF